MKSSDCAVVIPAFNEEATIQALVKRVLLQVEQVIVVDDGSTDGTCDELSELAVTVLKNGQNRGKAASLQHGFQYAMQQGCSAVITLDGDGQHAPEEIPRLLKAASDRPDTIIVAARLINREAAPPLRLFANKFADFWVSWASGYPVVDSQSGFRLYPATLLDSVAQTDCQAEGFVFESKIFIEAAKRGFYSVVVPVESIYLPDRRESHYRPFGDTSRIVLMIAWQLFKRGGYLPGLLRALGILADPRGNL
ncbi:MAG: glycosyltransferase family 2 protein [Candidatus Polarisedimenticolaceae bacterium]|nr:glycosyltransferase family 2 protein [Candidatus Polarisedimenticolaceae bacterium]